MFTGKAEKLFRKWWAKQPNSHFDYTHCYLVYGNSVLVRLDSIPLMFQWGIYQDWADSMGYCITVAPIDDLNSFTCSVLAPDSMSPFFETMEVFNEYKTRQEARNAAIKKLNEIINEE